jgi:beta-xylosidase
MKKKFYLFLVQLLLLNGLFFAQQNHNTAVYYNPVIPGDFPDPTIIRVGNTYYAAATSNDFAPCYPFYESKDLINWKQIGSVFIRPPKWAAKGFWAPELSYNNGTYFVYYAAKRKGDMVSCIGVATTRDPHKGFTDHGIIVDWGKEAIDPFVFKDDDGKLYITWKAFGLNQDRPSEILASELSPDGLSLVGKEFSLTRYDEGWKGEGAEGELIIKHGKYYYHLYSIGGCCDEHCTYEVFAARSTSIKGDWEQNLTPLLHGGDRWRCPGHGTVVETPDNRFYFLHHAYHDIDFQFIGRQGMLDELIWNEKTGWPQFKNGDTCSVFALMPFKNTVQIRDSVYSDDFSTNKNLNYWQWDLDRTEPKIYISRKKLILSSKQTGIVFAGLSPKTGDYSFVAGIAKPSDAQTGICVYSNSKNLLAYSINKSQITLFQEKNGERQILAQSNIPGKNPVSLKLEAVNGRLFRFFWSCDCANWTQIKTSDKSYDGAFLPPWGGAMRVGLVLDNRLNDKAEFTYVKMSSSFNK